jgi:hypothetical protein
MDKREEMFGQKTGASGTGAPQEDPAAAAARAERAATLLHLRGQFGHAAADITGSPAEKYLVEHRGLVGIKWPISLRYAPQYQPPDPAQSPRPCLLAAVTNPDGELVGLHTIKLNPLTGAKYGPADLAKLSYGSIGEGVIFLGDSGETPATLVISESVENGLTRRLIGPADIYACAGGVRWIEPKSYHRRVEILADTDKRLKARKLARDYARKGLQAYVIMVPDNLGPKGDLNDALQTLGLPVVERLVIEDAEPVARAGDSPVQVQLKVGSDVEIAQRCLEELENIYGPLVFDDGQLWRFDRTHFSALDSTGLARFIHRVDGAPYPGAKGAVLVIRLNEGRIRSIISALGKYRHDPEFFANAPRGINCESGFIQIDASGEPRLEPHSRRWRQRHIVRTLAASRGPATRR